jgi:hypothetical protein
MEYKNIFHENPVEVRSFDGTSVPCFLSKLHVGWRVPGNLIAEVMICKDLLPVQVVIASMRQLIRLKEGRTAKVKDIPGFLTQCIASKVGNPVYCQQGGQPSVLPARWATGCLPLLSCKEILHRKKSFRYYLPKPVCHLPISPWARINNL